MLIDTTNPSQIVLQVQAVLIDGTPVPTLSSASVRVYHIAAGVEVADLAATPLVQVGATSFWRYIWKPAALAVGHYFAEYTLVDVLAATKILTEDIDIRDIATNDNAQKLRYGGYVHIDGYYGSGGTPFPIGTPESKVSNAPDARVIADNLGIMAYKIYNGSALLDQDHIFWVFEGVATGAIGLEGHSVSGAHLESLRVCGVAINSLVYARNCVFWDGVTNLAGAFVDCFFNDRFLLSSGSSIFLGCASSTPAPARFYFQGNDVLVHFSAYSGSMELHDLSYPGSAVSVDLVGGTILIGASCTEGTVDIYGTGTVINNALGTVVTNHTLDNSTSVVSSDLALAASDITTLKKIESGTWKIINHQMIFYDTDGSTPLFTFNLFDEEGGPTNTNVFSRVHV